MKSKSMIWSTPPHYHLIIYNVLLMRETSFRLAFRTGEKKIITPVSPKNRDLKSGINETCIMPADKEFRYVDIVVSKLTREISFL